MPFTLDDHWVWDFWLAADGDVFHLYYLHAPKALGDQNLRHRNARVGHAISSNLVDWDDLGPVLQPGQSGDFDETATWTGSVLRGPDGIWRMFYTGARFLSPESSAHIQTVGVAISSDLHHWTKAGPLVSADPRWYETIGDSPRHEEAWRDPWVFADPGGVGFHMLITARANSGDDIDRGVVAHATSPDLESWQVHPPLTAPGAGFVHLEVPQIATVDGRTVLLFSCDSPALAGDHRGERGGIWIVEVDSPVGGYDARAARLLADESLYSGRIIQDRAGEWMLLAFENSTGDGGFAGSLANPIPVGFSGPGAVLTVDISREVKA